MRKNIAFVCVCASECGARTNSSAHKTVVRKHLGLNKCQVGRKYEPRSMDRWAKIVPGARRLGNPRLLGAGPGHTESPLPSEVAKVPTWPAQCKPTALHNMHKVTTSIRRSADNIVCIPRKRKKVFPYQCFLLSVLVQCFRIVIKPRSFPMITWTPLKKRLPICSNNKSKPQAVLL